MTSQAKMETIDVDNEDINRNYTTNNVPTYDAEAPVLVVPVAVLELDNVNCDKDSDDLRNKGGWKTKAFLYSPVYYWFKLLLSLAGLGSGINNIINYNHMCNEEEGPIKVGESWWILITILWTVQGLFHLLFIIFRIIKKSNVSSDLYDGPFERKMSLPLTIDIVLIILCCIWGLIMANTDTAVLPEQCGGKFNSTMQSRSIVYLIISLLFLKRFFCQGN
jgi:hypothetical protein